jgi:ribosomal protein L11 methyltransferase
MPHVKLVLEGDAEQALAAEAFLEAWQEAGQDAGASDAPLAVSRFEAVLPRWRVEAYFDAAAAGGVVKRMPAALVGLCRMEAVPDENWVAVVHATLSPVPAGRFLVHGPHDRAAAAGHANAIEIEASEAFGTAHHGSTVGCLVAIDRLAAAGAHPLRVLDLGTGSGILAIAALMAFPDASALATDFDARSVEIAVENARLNGVGERVEGLVATGLAHPQLSGARFDLILANILAEPLIALAPALGTALAPGATLVLAGLLTTQAEEVTAAYRHAGLRLARADDFDGWTTLVVERG